MNIYWIIFLSWISGGVMVVLFCLPRLFKKQTEDPQGFWGTILAILLVIGIGWIAVYLFIEGEIKHYKEQKQKKLLDLESRRHINELLTFYEKEKKSEDDRRWLFGFEEEG